MRFLRLKGRPLLNLLLVFGSFAISRAEETTRQPAASYMTELPKLQIEIGRDDWGSASRDDILAVCSSAGRELTPIFPRATTRTDCLGTIEFWKPHHAVQTCTSGEIRMMLNTRDTFWAQFAYQFGHELCHVLCNYREADNPQLWFEESLCETASLFVLRRMADSWKTDPPYSNWKTFAPAFDNYVDDRLSNTAKFDEKTFAEWYRNHRVEFEKNGTNRELNLVVAVRVLLPLLQMKPQHWQALDSLNQWDPKGRPTFQEYLQDWHDRVPEVHRSFVLAIAQKFEVKLK
jgi:hypothetical protein